MKPPSPFSLQDEAKMKETVESLLVSAKRTGATSAEISLIKEAGFSISVRMGEVETIEHHRGKSLSLTVYFDHRSGSITTSDFSPEALRTGLEKACNIARYTEEDPCSGLADSDVIAYEYPNLDLYHPWHITPEQAIERARECEEIARGFDKRITNSDGACVNTHDHHYVYGNTHDFIGEYSSSYHSMSCSLIAQHAHEMESDSDYTCGRDATDLIAIPTLAKKAAERTVMRLGAKKIPTQKAPVILSADVARGFFGHFLNAISGGNLYRKSSFLLDCISQRIFPEFIQIKENPHLRKGVGSAPFDHEGVATRSRSLISEGILQSYLLSSYTARKLGLKTTGNAGGAHNVCVKAGHHDLKGLLRFMGTGLLVTGVMGQGVNIVTGDYSRGAFGYWVDNGEIVYPVNEITIAGNLKDLFLNLVAVGNDIDYRGNIQTGSVLLESMMIAGD